MTFEDIEKEFYESIEWPTDLKQIVTTTSAILFAKYVFNEQQQRIDELEEWIAAIADDHSQIPDWIQQSAKSLLA